MRLLDIDRSLARDSYYAATAAPRAPFAPLDGDARCDVAIVGGGLAGLSAALELAERGRQVRLVEAQRLGWGASGRNGGQAIHGLSCDQGVIEQQLGLDGARRVWAMSIEALDLLRQRITRHAIDCDWRDGWLGLATSPRKASALDAWAERLAQVYGYPLERFDRGQARRWIDSPRFHGGVFDARSGHLHPLKYTQGIAAAAAAAGARLHEQTAATAIEPGTPLRLRTASGTLSADQVLLAGNVYLSGLAPQLEPRIMPAGTYIACSEPLDPALLARLIPSGAAACDTDFVLDYFRPTADHRMLYGGRVSYSTRTPPGLREGMRRRMVATFAQLRDARITHAWGGFVDITMNRAPDFGRTAAGLYHLQGFSGHGLALTGLAGRLVAEAICGDASRFDVFARLRHRPFPGGRALRMPTLVLGMAWMRLRDMLS